MDILGSVNTEMLRANALHRPKDSQRAANYESEIEERNAALIGEFRTRRANVELEGRRANQRMAASAVGGDVYAAIPRFYDPEQYFRQTQIPYRINVDKERFELYKWLDLFYRTHFLIPILVDIFTRFPLAGVELASPDKALKQFYEDAFFDRLDYEQFMVDMGREYWTLGQTFPMGHFNETMGVWSEEELLDPTIVKVKQYQIIGGKQFFVEPPRELVEIAKKKHPKNLYYLLERDYGDFLPYLLNKDDIPISDVLLRQVAFKASRRDMYGTPILLRALRTLMHEEKLMASQDAIAERLYSPLILAKLGTNDMGPNRPPFIPGPAEIGALRNDLDIALNSDFRVLVHHFAIEVQNVFGREQMPRLDADFDRIERRIMQTFGVNPNLLSGGAASAPYASSALQAEFLNQILRTYQGFLKKHYKERALIVAEAQGHYAYEKRGDTRIPIVEEVLVKDPETGEETVEKRKKLMIPEMRMKVLDLRDEATQRQFLQALKQQGVPIPDQDVAMGMHYDFHEALEKMQEELIAKTVAQQEAKVNAYKILKAKGLPIPADLQQEIERAGVEGPQPGEETQLGIDAPRPGEPIMMPPPPEGRPPGRMDQPEVSQERMPGIGDTATGPVLPGVPGQPGAMGIPGAPTPAIGPVRPGPAAPTPRPRASVRHDGEDALLEELPRRQQGEKLSRLRPEDDSATLEETSEESEE